MKTIHALEHWIVRVNPIALVVVMLSISVLRAGVWTIPSISSLNTLALNPFVNPYDGINQYLYTNWLSPFIAWLLGATDQWRFILLHFSFSLIFLIVVVVSLARSLPGDQWRKAVCAFAMLPVSWTHLYWVGYDSLVLALMALAMASIRRPLLAVLPGVGLGLQHFEVGLAAFLLLALVIAISLGRKACQCEGARGAIVVASGVLIGRGCLWMVMRAHHVVVTSDRSNYLFDKCSDAVRLAFFNGPMVLTSFLGVGWVLILHYQSAGRYRLGLAVALLAAIGLSVITLDNTRVFALTTFPVIAYCLLYSREWLEKVPFNLLAVLLLVWISTPAIFSWGAKPQTSVIPYDLAVISHGVFHWPSLPERQIRPLWPFTR